MNIWELLTQTGLGSCIVLAGGLLARAVRCVRWTEAQAVSRHHRALRSGAGRARSCAS